MCVTAALNIIEFTPSTSEEAASNNGKTQKLLPDLATQS